MPHPAPVAEDPADAPTVSAQPGPDPEFEALPKPRRPWRRVTLAVLIVTAVFSLWVGHRLRPQVLYALNGWGVDQPLELGELSELEPVALVPNTWVRGAASLAPQSVRYRRPADPDYFRLARVAGEAEVWVELRVPKDYRENRYLPPGSFVGRLVPFRKSGLRHDSLLDAVEAATGEAPSRDAWLLIDGESPASARWVLAVILMLFGFAGFSVWGLWRVLRPRSA